MKLIEPIPEIDEIPLTFIIDNYDEQTAFNLLNKTVQKANEINYVILEALHEKWAKKTTLNIKIVLTSFFFSAMRHLLATITLCETKDLSEIAIVHQRQILELYLQIKYFVSFNDDKKNTVAQKIAAIGCIEFLEKMKDFKDHDFIKKNHIKRI